MIHVLLRYMRLPCITFMYYTLHYKLVLWIMTNLSFMCVVGVHYIGEMRNNTVARMLINQLTDGHLQWVDLIDEFDLVGHSH